MSASVLRRCGNGLIRRWRSQRLSSVQHCHQHGRQLLHHPCQYSSRFGFATLSTDLGTTAADAATSSSPSAIPTQARVVVVGGGIIGTSVAYHLAHAGWKDVVVVEQSQVTSGTTWHAAGLCVTFGSTSETSTSLRKYSKQLYETDLEAETGQSTGFRGCGFIELATNEDRLEEYRRVAAFNRYCGVDVHEISPQEVLEKFPLCRIDDVLAGFYVPTDGRVNPVDATMALMQGARQQGVRFITDVRVTGVKKQSHSHSDTSAHRSHRVCGVTTTQGDIDCEYVVNCAGMWARQFGEMAGVTIPLQAAEHYYLITDTMPEVDPMWPVVEDPSHYGYYREEGGGLMVGLFEPHAGAWNVQHIPEHFSFGEIEPDWERMTPFLERAMSRIPRTQEVGLKKFFCGPESFTPDLQPMVGETPELQNYFVCAGLNSIGILTGPGMGRLVAHWIMNGKSDLDVTGINVDRAHPYQLNPEYRAHRVVESLGMVYKCHYPTYTMSTARGIKRSPIYERLRQRGAYFKDVSGWEGADWYSPTPGVIDPDQGQLSWNRHDWFPHWAQEHRACREGCIIMDMSFMSKFRVQGVNAGRFLNYISTNNVDDQEGQITYTQWLDDDGNMEADLTVCKLSSTEYFVVVTDTMHRHAEAWMRKQLRLHPELGAHVVIDDVSGATAQLNIQGPRSRELMSMLVEPHLHHLDADTDSDGDGDSASSSSRIDIANANAMSNTSFPFRSAQYMSIGYARVLVVRITYLGELGYELYVPAEHALHVYDRIIDVGEDSTTGVGLQHAGLKALSSLRMEKAYRDYGHDMDNTDTLLECGLGFTCDFDKAGGFIGREAVLQQKSQGILSKRMVQVLVRDPQPFLHHAEVLRRDGIVQGYIRAGSYGHTLGGACGLAMLESADNSKITKKWLSGGRWTVEIADCEYECDVSLAPMYDPKNERIKA